MAPGRAPENVPGPGGFVERELPKFMGKTIGKIWEHINLQNSKL